MKVIVTGGSGFIGSNLVDRLIEESFDTSVIDNLSTGKRQFLNPKARFYEADILDIQKMKLIFEEVKPEAVFHLAAQIDVQTSIKNPIIDAQINILGTINIIELCKIYNSKLIYSSSAAVYGPPLYLPVSELHPINPISNYGISKYTPELFIRSYAQLYDVKSTILRYSNVYGPRQMPKGEGGVISIFISKMLNNEIPTIYGDGKQTRDFIYVEDVVSANLFALKVGKNGTYNISTNKRLSINEVHELINGILNKNIPPEYKPVRIGDITHSCLDNQQAKINLNWEPRYSITEGLTKTCQCELPAT
ncbi:NAD-dependent epimerase/dehydratase family protein [Bacillus sp. FDAARGOS_1420]|uniref:NAD-dependent epimerase/dehydratase family protein n=1 Tax=unclassified Bacillus (in: firmicutes) TaxID=185979 RepID=UPI001C5AEE19|nr:NAD-dependent epimerase/dehydratase family protein [Bacillus sp. FDAARGOS_1420]MBW3496781.1 GDP-mannose 4,6-dehydratase [Bacillus sp. FDAARGOS_1420]